MPKIIKERPEEDDIKEGRIRVVRRKVKRNSPMGDRKLEEAKPYISIPNIAQIVSDSSLIDAAISPIKPKGIKKKKNDRSGGYFDEHPNDGRFELESAEAQARNGSLSPSDPKVEIKKKGKKKFQDGSNLHMTVQNFNKILEKNLEFQRNPSIKGLIQDKMSRTSYYPKQETILTYHKNQGYSPQRIQLQK